MKHLSKWLVGLALPAALSAFAVTESKNGATLTTYNLPDGWIQTLSDNGRWAIWTYPSNDEPDARLSIIDVQQGKMVEMPVNDEYLAGGAKAVPADITNDGKKVFGSYVGQPAYYDAESHNWNLLPLPRSLRKWNGEVDMCTPDGKTLIGIVHQAWSIFTSLIWEWNEQTEEYEVVNSYNYPTREDVFNAGLMLPGDWQEYQDAGDVDGNIRIFQVSADGKYAIGGIDHNRNWGNACFLYDLAKKEWSWLTYVDETDGKTYYARSAKMSNDGNWLYGNMQGFDMDDDEQYVVGRNFLKNMKTGEMTFPKALGPVDVIDNAGRFYYAVGASVSNPVSSLCVESDGHLVDLHMILNQVYGIDFGALTGWTATGFTMGISDDGLVLAANAYPRQAGYTVMVPEPLQVSASKVNVLSNYQYAPAWGSELAHFKSLTLALSNPASVSETLKAQILDKDGKSVAESVTITPVNDANQMFVITFPEQIFAKGDTYTVVIPEGLFYVANTTSKNPEIKVEYKGREDGPVTPVAYSPESGTSVREVNMTNPAVVTFNAELAKVNGIYGGLYAKGSDTPITQLDFTVNGKSLLIYSPSDYKLKEGTDYVLKIPAGVVTDIVGFCANEAFELEYAGAFVSGSGKDPNKRFFDDFNDPNESLNKWLNYEGDHNTPIASMGDLGFDADNTPWNFSIKDSEDSNDYCAASHSQYSPAGKSDDWMVTPQILIDNKEIWLSFKTQGYSIKKEDKLKVYVWPCEDEYGSMSTDLINRIKKEGTVIFDERVLPGASEKTLAGDWQEKKIQLDQFLDKKVYIAFVNENENQSMVFVDDVLVEYTGNYVTGLNTESTVVEKDEVPVKAFVTNKSNNVVKKITATYNNPATGSTDTFTADVNLAKNDTYSFTFNKPMKLAYGEENKYTVDFNVDGEKQTVTDVVKNLKYDFKKKVLVEEVTGMWCGNCPQGPLAFEYIESVYPGQLIPVAVHNNDIYAFPAYESFLQLNAYPTGKVNRGAEALSPMFSSKFASANRDQTWFDYVSRELETPAELKIEILEADYCLESEKYEVKYNVEFAMNKDNINYNIFTVVLENELPSVQHNYFYNQTDPIYGKWGQGGEYGQAEVTCKTDHVARGIAGSSFYGENGKIPGNARVDEPTTGWVAINPPALFHTDKETHQNDKISIACVVIDNATGIAITGDIIHHVGVKDKTGAREIADDVVNADIVVTVTDGTIYANGNDRNVEIYTLDGTRVANEGLSGLYIVRAFDEDGNVKVVKLVVR